MRPSHWPLRVRVLGTLGLVVLVAGVAFLAAGATLIWILPPPAPEDIRGHLLGVVGGTALGASFVAGGVALVLGRYLVRGITRPLGQLTTAIYRLSRGHYTPGMAPLRAPGLQQRDELGRLATAVNDLATALEAAERRRILSFGEVTHEIRTPVAILQGYMEGLLDGHIKPSARTWAMLHDEASRVHRLVDELQLLARAEAGQERPDLIAVDPARIAQSALDGLRLHFETKGLQVRTDIAPGLPLVLADADQAVQALVNFLTNALRFTPVPGQVTLAVSRLAGTKEVVFRVSDTGVGIAAEHIPHLFERFFRVDRTSSRHAAGSGIGLPVAKALVEAMGGRIWAESPGLGQGSTFSFTLLVADIPRPG